jgi:hypothetical protein
MILDRHSYITWIGFVLKRVVKPFESRVRVSTFETEWTTIFRILHEVLAIIWLVKVNIRRSSKILGFVSIDALSPIMLDILLRAVSCLVLVHIEHMWIHDAVHL